MRHIVIPARYASTRFEGKPLALLHNSPMILHVAHKAQQAVAAGVAADMCIATDDKRIAQVCTAAGYDVVMTANNHPSGTDRLAEVAQKKGWADDDVVINIQGDEPLIPIKLVSQVADLLESKPQCVMATLAEPLLDASQLSKPSVVKVVMTAHQEALYFSRASIPRKRDADSPAKLVAYRHLGLYAYRVKLLHDFVTWQMGVLESLESLEQLRVLENGERIAIDVAHASLPAGVDTPEDLAALNKLPAEHFAL